MNKVVKILKISIFSLAFLALSCKGAKKYLKHEVDIIAEDSTNKKVDLPVQKIEVTLSQFENNENYFIKDIDINKDGILDKIISSVKYEGNELYLFENVNGEYKLTVESINSSEDGGKIIGDIFPLNTADEVFKIQTFFPKGNSQAIHFIMYRDNNWFLKRTVYETSNWRKNDTIYLCEVDQDLNLKDLLNPEVIKKLKQIPEESKREFLCIKK